jgi:hypothetical protein
VGVSLNNVVHNLLTVQVHNGSLNSEKLLTKDYAKVLGLLT